MSEPGKPTVAVFTLGGTIAMLRTPDGRAVPALSASDLLAVVPGLDSVGVELKLRHFARNGPRCPSPTSSSGLRKSGRR
jgi:L-asparaginase/Glu-tRNA(Gln) amidotransferase subunit D